MSDLLSRMRGIEDADVAGKRVLVRADLNVPMKDGQVTDTTRLDRVVPTIRSLSERGAKVVIITHFGRPGGEKVPEMSVAPVAAKLGELLGQPVKFVADCIGPVAAEGVNAMNDGDVAMLENLRFFLSAVNQADGLPFLMLAFSSCLSPVVSFIPCTDEECSSATSSSSSFDSAERVSKHFEPFERLLQTM